MLNSIGRGSGFSYNVLIPACDSMRPNDTLLQCLISPTTHIHFDEVGMHKQHRTTQPAVVSRGSDEVIQGGNEENGRCKIGIGCLTVTACCRAGWHCYV